MLILLSLVQSSVDMYIKAFTVLYFSRETRKTDTDEKHFELVETLFNPSISRLFTLMLIYV